MGAPVFSSDDLGADLAQADDLVIEFLLFFRRGGFDLDVAEREVAVVRQFDSVGGDAGEVTVTEHADLGLGIDLLGAGGHIGHELVHAVGQRGPRRGLQRIIFGFAFFAFAETGAVVRTDRTDHIRIFGRSGCKIFGNELTHSRIGGAELPGPVAAGAARFFRFDAAGPVGGRDQREVFGMVLAVFFPRDQPGKGMTENGAQFLTDLPVGAPGGQILTVLRGNVARPEARAQTDREWRLKTVIAVGERADFAFRDDRAEFARPEIAHAAFTFEKIRHGIIDVGPEDVQPVSFHRTFHHFRRCFHSDENPFGLFSCRFDREFAAVDFFEGFSQFLRGGLTFFREIHGAGFSQFEGGHGEAG